MVNNAQAYVCCLQIFPLDKISQELSSLRNITIRISQSQTFQKGIAVSANNTNNDDIDRQKVKYSVKTIRLKL